MMKFPNSTVLDVDNDSTHLPFSDTSGVAQAPEINCRLCKEDVPVTKFARGVHFLNLYECI